MNSEEALQSSQERGVVHTKASSKCDRQKGSKKKKKKGIVRKGELKCSCDTRIFFLFYKIHIPKLLAFLPKITPEELRLWNLIEFKF